MLKGCVRLKNKKGIIIILFVLVIVILFFLLSNSGIIGIAIDGIAYVANNTRDYTDKNGYIITDECNFEVDLSNLQSNVGKQVYNDGKHKIYVSWIDNTGSIRSGGYRIGFRAKGEYSVHGATLISGVKHIAVTDNSFTYDMSAKMRATYKEKTYDCSVFGTSGLNYRDGDDFSFYIFPSVAYEKNEISLDEKGKVSITITNLYKNIWNKK